MQAIHGQAQSAFVSVSSTALDSGWTLERAKGTARPASWLHLTWVAASESLSGMETHEVIEGAVLLAVSSAAAALMMAIFSA